MYPRLSQRLFEKLERCLCFLCVITLGDNGLKELQSRGRKPAQSNRLTSTARAAPSSSTAGSSSTSSSKDDNEPANVELTWESDISDKFNVYFPTHDTVAQSKGGTGVRTPPSCSLSPHFVFCVKKPREGDTGISTV